MSLQDDIEELEEQIKAILEAYPLSRHTLNIRET
jgi:hypothetical protein